MKVCCRLLISGVRVLILLISVFAALAPAVAQPNPFSTFLDLVQTKTESRGSCNRSAACTCSISDEQVAMLLLSLYGSVFAASEAVRLPSRCIFENELQVSEYQRQMRQRSEVMDGVTIELQDTAMATLIAALAEASKLKLRITPLDGSIAGRRSYSDTVRIWKSRYLKALDHWVRRGKIAAKEADIARKDNALVQIRKVISWESQGLNFGTNIKGSIFSSTAPPGTSQHLSMLAFDVVQYSNNRVRSIMNKHGWYQTVANDPPHFTFLGLTEKELPSRGLKNIVRGNYNFWVPDLR